MNETEGLAATQIPVLMREADAADMGRLQEIRAAAFAPVFASFRQILGDALYDLTQRASDQTQGEFLESLFAADSPWTVYAATRDDVVVGFVSVRVDEATAVGEIGLNAVDPASAGRGVGTLMYQFALDRFRAAGMRAATVGTGGDRSHAPARRAYEKAGFEVSIPSLWLVRPLD
jgi:ribosomal protein S18 acetylase RimI-like enzyme